MVVQTVNVIEFQNGKVIHATQYFCESFEAPAWRLQWVEKATSLMNQFDAIVFRSGQAGMPLSIALAAVGQKTALVEREHEELNTLFMKIDK